MTKNCERTTTPGRSESVKHGLQWTKFKCVAVRKSSTSYRSSEVINQPKFNWSGYVRIKRCDHWRFKHY